jgi:hypothetical protein
MKKGIREGEREVGEKVVAPLENKQNTNIKT